MYRRSFVMCYFDKRTFLLTVVMLFWVAGLSLGVFADRFYGEAYRACLRLTPYQIPDFLQTVSIHVLPLLISAYAVCFCPAALIVIYFVQGFITGLGISAIAALFGSAAGMMAGLLLFSLLLKGPVFLWYGLFGGFGDNYKRAMVCCIVLTVLICWLDHCAVAPFLREIMIF